MKALLFSFFYVFVIIKWHIIIKESITKGYKSSIFNLSNTNSIDEILLNKNLMKLINI